MKLKVVDVLRARGGRWEFSKTEGDEWREITVNKRKLEWFESRKDGDRETCVRDQSSEKMCSSHDKPDFELPEAFDVPIEAARSGEKPIDGALEGAADGTEFDYDVGFGTQQSPQGEEHVFAWAEGIRGDAEGNAGGVVRLQRDKKEQPSERVEDKAAKQRRVEIQKETTNVFNESDAFKTPKLKTPAVAGFMTGSGAKVSICQTKLDAAAKLFADLAPQEEDDDLSFEKVNLPQGMELQTASLFSTGKGTAVKISKDKLDAASKLFNDIHGDEQSPKIRLNETPNLRDKSGQRHTRASTPVRMQQTAHASDTGGKSRFAVEATRRRSSSMGSISSAKHRVNDCMSTPAAGMKKNLPCTEHCLEKFDRNILSQRVANVINGAVQPDDSANEGRWKESLPLTPRAASLYVFDGGYGPGDIRAWMLELGAKPDVITDAWIRYVE